MPGVSGRGHGKLKGRAVRGDEQLQVQAQADAWLAEEGQGGQAGGGHPERLGERPRARAHARGDGRRARAHHARQREGGRLEQGAADAEERAQA